jgi:hypothetical protein
MSPLDISLQYMEIFFSGQNIVQLNNILDDDLKFDGPFFSFSSCNDYVESLLSDPPVGCSYHMIQSFENGNMVNLIYEFSKPGINTLMSQLFEVQEGQITRIVLIFDSGNFTK